MHVHDIEEPGELARVPAGRNTQRERDLRHPPPGREEKMAAILCKLAQSRYRGYGSKENENYYRLLFLLHARGHLGHGPVDGGIFVQVREILTAEDG